MALKLYADEDCPGPVVKALRDAGYDILSQRDVKRGVADDDVLRLAAMADRILITRDLGFGRLTVLDQLPSIGGFIIRLRGPGDWVARASRVVEAVAELGDRAAGAISTIDWHVTRTRPLPKRQPT